MIVIAAEAVNARAPAGARSTEPLEALAAAIREAGPIRGGLVPFTHVDGRLVAADPVGADPLAAVLVGSLRDGVPPVRWGIVVDDTGRWRTAGPVPPARDDGRAARALLDIAGPALDIARSRRELLVIRTGDPGADGLLDATAPLLAGLLGELSPRQRILARMLLLDGLRQADAADVLGVSRATVSVMVARGRIRAIERLAGAVRAIVAAAQQAGGAAR